MGKGKAIEWVFDYPEKEDYTEEKMIFMRGKLGRKLNRGRGQIGVDGRDNLLNIKKLYGNFLSWLICLPPFSILIISKTKNH